MRSFVAAVLLSVAAGTLPFANGESSTEGKGGDYTVAIYYWPNFHRDAYHQSKKGEGWTEWEIVKNAKPKFDGHDQPKVPLWGYRDESDPQENQNIADRVDKKLLEELSATLRKERSRFVRE